MEQDKLQPPLKEKPVQPNDQIAADKARAIKVLMSIMNSYPEVETVVTRKSNYESR